MIALALAVLIGAPALLDQKGCLLCHSIDGARKSGPTLLGLTDEAHLRRSIVEPAAETTPGYTPGTMPQLPLTPEEVDGLVAEIRALPSSERRASGTGSPALYLAAGLVFLFGHLGLSFWPVRTRLVSALGNGWYLGLYSLMAAGSMTWLVWKWSSVPYLALWTAPAWTRWIPNLVMPIVSIAATAGMTTPPPLKIDPTSGQAVGEARARGVYKITRHPGLFSTALWGLAHLVVNGDFTSVVLFGSMTGLALIGPFHIESRYRKRFGEKWTVLDRESSVVPFAAIAAGKARVSLEDFGLKPIGIGLLVWLAIYLSHQWMFGASPLPR